MFELYDLRNNFMYYHDFYISAKEKSIAEASRKHNISSSSLSRSISMLENMLNLDLVVTNNKGFELTADGNRIYKTLDNFFHTIDIFSSDQLSSNLDVVLTIGTTRNIADFMLSEYITKFCELYPNVEINIRTDSASNLNEALNNRKIDVLIDYIRNINYSEKYDLEIKPIAEYKTCFACSKSYYEKIKDKVKTIKDLENYKLTIPGNSRRRQMLDETLHKYNFNIKKKHLMPDSKLMADFIKSNDLIGYFIDDELELYDLVKINLKEEMPTNPVGVIYPKRTINHVAKDFINVISECNKDK